MKKQGQGVGRALVGLMTAAACAPLSIDLAREHAGAGAENAGTDETGAGALDGAGSSSVGGSSPQGGRAGAPRGGGAGRANTNAGSGGTVGPTSGGTQGQSGEGTVVSPACGDGTLSDAPNGHDVLPGYAAAPDPRVLTWLAAMSLSDQITQMQGVWADPVSPNYWDIQRSNDVTLQNGTTLRGYRYRSGSRGVSLYAGQPDRPSDAKDYATAFPSAAIRGASWDLDLEWRIGEAIGDETTATRNNLLLGPSADVIRHPYWGRTQDSYGEDTYHIGRMGAAFVAGVQQRIGACAESLLTNGVEQYRSVRDTRVDEQSLREIYARPFEMLVADGGVACVMAGYNLVNGVKSTANQHLLRDILKGAPSAGGFGFRGFVVSDWWAAPGDQSVPPAATALAVAADLANAGLDVELPWTLHYDKLADAVGAGLVTSAVVADAAARVLEQKARFESALTSDGYGRLPSTSSLSDSSVTTNPNHLDLAEEAELKSAVLLDNGRGSAPVLPLQGGVKSLAVLGAEVPYSLISTTYPPGSPSPFDFTTYVALGDRGTNAVNANPVESVGPFAGIQAAANEHGVTTVLASHSASDATSADVVVVVVGFTPGDEGEEYAIPAGGDRSSLTLPAGQNDLVEQALSLMKPTIVIVESGSVVAMPWLEHDNRRQATIWAGYGGMRAGAAFGKLLFGDANFSGKLAMAWAGERALPPFKDVTAEQVVDLDYFFGYRDYDRRTAAGENVEVVFPFGRGLSYTTFAYSDLTVPCEEVTTDAVVDVTATVTNTGTRSGDEVAFLFVAGPSVPNEQRSVKELKSFARVALAPGQASSVHLPVRIRDLRHWSTAKNAWVVDRGEYRVLVGPSGATDDLKLAGTFTIGG